MSKLLYRLGKFSAQKSWSFIGVWLLLLALAVGGLAIGFKGLSSSFDIPGTASGEVTEKLEEKLSSFSGATGIVVFSTESGEKLTESQKAEISKLINESGSLSDVSEVIDPFSTEAQRATQKQQLEQAGVQISQGQKQIDQGFAQLNPAITQLEEAIKGSKAAGLPTKDLETQLSELKSQKGELELGQTELNSQKESLEFGTKLLELSDGIQLVSTDGSTALVNVAFTETRLNLPEESKQGVIEHFSSVTIDGVNVSFSTDIAQGVPELFGIAEGIGVIFAAVVLLVLLGSLIGAVLPLITALVGVGVGVAGSLGLSGFVEMTSVTPILGLMLGLAVGIDYSLFIVNRHRKQLATGVELNESIALANGTAGNSVVFAGSTVVVALLALNVTGVPFLGTMGTVGAACVAIAVLVAISMTPALLKLAGTKLLSKKSEERLKLKAQKEQGELKPMSNLRAVLRAVLSVAVLAVLAIPFFSMRVGLPDGGSEPAGSSSYQAFTTIEDKFSAGNNSPLLVTAELDSKPENELALLKTQYEVAQLIADQEQVVSIAPIAVSDDQLLLAFQVIPVEGPNSESTEDLVNALRSLDTEQLGLTLGTAGQAAINIDISESLMEILPLYLAIVIGLSLLIMIVVFRSILVPLIATAGFVLSLFATYGATVAVFQWGWLGEVFGIHNPGPILSFLPVILIGILFGLAMDYQLFLASGMREAYVHGSEARVAVVRGFRSGRSVVVAAALIMIFVFGGFVFTESTIVRSIGFGLAIGVLLDAFIVRMLLMPALMHLIGKSAWWLPKWLDRILPNVDVEGAALERSSVTTEK